MRSRSDLALAGRTVQPRPPGSRRPRSRARDPGIRAVHRRTQRRRGRIVRCRREADVRTAIRRVRSRGCSGMQGCGTSSRSGICGLRREADRRGPRSRTHGGRRREVSREAREPIRAGGASHEETNELSRERCPGRMHRRRRGSEEARAGVRRHRRLRRRQSAWKRRNHPIPIFEIHQASYGLRSQECCLTVRSGRMGTAQPGARRSGPKQRPDRPERHGGGATGKRTPSLVPAAITRR